MIERYTPTIKYYDTGIGGYEQAEMIANKEGDCVLYVDHAAALAAKDAEIAQLRRGGQAVSAGYEEWRARAERAEQEAVELRTKLDLVHEAGLNGISHVAAANYAERIREAKAGLQFAYYGGEEAPRAGGGQ